MLYRLALHFGCQNGLEVRISLNLKKAEKLAIAVFRNYVHVLYVIRELTGK